MDMALVKAIVNIDVVDIETGEVYEIIEGIWGGDVKKIIADIEARYNIVNIDRESYENRIAWVQA